ncbi:MAG: hypothetical protein GWP05_06865 [Anaerolineaceae bacterium]|nr:hypothetical protein [Anaerolineaceae bacterium]
MRADGFINLALERTKARVKTNDLVTGLLGLLATVLAYLLAVVVVDQSVHLEHSTRIWLLIILGLVVVLGMAAILLWPTIKRVNDLFAARLIERQAEDLFRNSLVTFVQVRGDDTVPRDVRGAIEAKAARDLSAIDVELAVNRRPLRFAVVALLVAGALMLVFALTSSKSFTVSMSRALGSTAVAPTATRIVQVRTDPEGPSVMAGTNVRVVVVTADREPESVELRMTRGGTYQDLASMNPLDRRTWEFVIENLLQDLKFNVQAGDARSRTYAIAVRPLPAITDVQTVLTFPAYTLLQPQTHDSGHVEALVGTRVEVIARMNQEPRRPELIFGDGGRRQPMRTNGNSHRARAEFTVSGPDSYHLRFLDKSLKYNNASAIEYQVTPLADQAPGVELDRSGSEVRVAEGGGVPLVVCASDDYGLDRLTARWQRVRPGGVGKVRSIELQRVPADQAVLRIEDRFTVELSKMGLGRGDQALVWVRATDRLPGGAQEGQSPPLRVLVVPPEEAPTAGGGGQSQTDQPQTAGGQGRTGSSRQKTTGLTPQERKGLENFRRTLDKLRPKSRQRPGDGQPASGQPSEGTGQQPKGKPSDKPNGDGGTSGAGDAGDAGGSQRPPGDGPAESPGQEPSGRGPDQQPKQRLTRFDESGRSKDEPQTDGDLLRTVGPQIRRVAKQFRRGTVDPKLLKELGWSETELRRFVTGWQADDRFEKFVDGPKSTRQTVVSPADDRPITTSAGPGDTGGTVGSGATSSVGQSDEMIENFEARQGRTSPRYRQLIEEYLKAVSEAESNSN